MKGFKTVIFGALVAIMPALIGWMEGYNWDDVGPWAAPVVGAIIIVLRWMTDTPMFKSHSNVPNPYAPGGGQALKK